MVILMASSFFFSSQKAEAQFSVKDSVVNAMVFSPHLSYHIPAYDMKDRFYNSTGVGLSPMYKTKHNWIFGADFTYIFAEKVRNEDDILSNIATSEGFVIDKTGVFANIHFRERGFYTGLKIGKLFPVFSPNPNSGIVFWAGAGVLQHKIRIEVQENTAPQLDGDYKKGYDKLTNGYAASQFLGYMLFSNSKLTNFYIGIELIEGWTANRRSYDYVMMQKDNEKRFDMLTTIRFGWVIPVYRRSASKYYVN